MIRLVNLDKYFYRGQSNQIHVINDISLDLPENGLISFLGPSGCGKTTLLNVIGGLDNPDKGSIYYCDKQLQKSNLDEFRINNVGFIFQNYILFPNKTVHENLRLVLQMFELSPTEMDERIEYALKAVGLEKFKKRPAGQLSGGQMQRVSIARALVKSPKVIIADEPTGNLDEKNTRQIMNIIRKLSLNCLVILVTHEKRLAEFYSDRIIELLDGKIVKDRINSASEALMEKDDTNIYLQELDNISYIEKDVAIRYFYHQQRPKLKLDVVFRNNTFFIKPSSDSEKYSFKLVDDGSDALIVDSKKPELKIEEVDNFEYELKPIEKKINRGSVIKLKNCMQMAWDYIKELKTKKKLFLLIFVLSAILVVFSMGTLSKSIIVNDMDFQQYSKEAILVTNERGITDDELLALEEKLGVAMFLPETNNLLSNFNFNIYHQTSSHIFSFSEHSTEDINNFKGQLIYGRMPENVNEIIIDRWLVDKLLIRNNLMLESFIQAGGSGPKQMLGQKVYLTYDYMANSSENYATIVGVCDTNNPIIYADVDLILSSYLTITQYLPSDKYDNALLIATPEIAGINEYTDLSGNLKTITETTLAGNHIIVNEELEMFVETDTIISGNNKNYEIIGYFNGDSSTNYIVSSETLKTMNYDSIFQFGSFIVDSSHNQDALKILIDENYDAKMLYQVHYEIHRLSTTMSTIVLLVVALVFLVSSMIFLYFTMRASLISRIYEIGVYRALGVKKFDICKMFICELLLITLFTTVIGYIIGSFIVIQLQNSLLSFVMSYEWYTAVITFAIICGFNFIVGLLPVSMLMKLTPAQILSKYDI